MRRATWLVLWRDERRDEEEAEYLAQLRVQHTEVDEAILLVQDFARMCRKFWFVDALGGVGLAESGD